jgi:hypothetical protein
LSFPQPLAAGAGGDISGPGWRDAEGFGPADVNIHLNADGATVIPGPLAVFGTKDNGECGFVGLLNEGQDIHIQSAAVGADFPVAGAGMFKRLLVGGYTGTSTPAPAAAVTVVAIPIWTQRS